MPGTSVSGIGIAKTLHLLDPLTSRQFKAFKASSKEGRAASLFTVLAVLSLLMAFATLTKF